MNNVWKRAVGIECSSQQMTIVKDSVFICYFDDCGFSRLGFLSLSPFEYVREIHASAFPLVNIKEDFIKEFLISQEVNVKRYLVVKLPQEPRKALMIILKLKKMRKMLNENFVNVVIVSPFSVNFIRRLSCVIDSADFIILESRIKKEEFIYLLTRPFVKIKNNSAFSIDSLTCIEFEFFYNMLNLHNTKDQALDRGVSIKTAYTVKYNILRKLGVSSIHNLFSNMMKWKN